MQNNDVRVVLSNFSEFISSKQDKDSSIKHHLEYYSGNIPIWVLIEHLTLGDIATFVTYLDRSVRKKWIRSFMHNTKDTWIIEWIKVIQFLRNTGAHCSRFYGRRFNYNPTFHADDIKLLPSAYEVDEIDKLIHTLFGGLSIMKRFYLKLPDYEKKHWNTFLDKLEKRINEFSADIYCIGFPENWKECLTLNS